MFESDEDAKPLIVPDPTRAPQLRGVGALPGGNGMAPGQGRLGVGGVFHVSSRYLAVWGTCSVYRPSVCATVTFVVCALL